MNDLPPSPGAQPEAQPGPAPGLRAIFLAFSKIGLTSFGGGLSGWMLIEFVQRRRWLSEERFMNGLALAQSFPGVNVVNLAIWIGFELGGGRGALLAAFGVVVPPMFVAIGLASILAQLSDYPAINVAMMGVAAAAVAISLNLGLRALRRASRRIVPALIAASTFIAIFVLGFPLYAVVCVMAPLSIAYAYLQLRQGENP